MWTNCVRPDVVIPPGGQFVEKKNAWQVNYCFPSCFTLNSAANRAGLIICVNKRDASLLSSILKWCPSLLPPLSPCWLYLTVPPSHRHRWQSVSLMLPESHSSPTDGPDHSRSRYETREEIRHNSPFYLELIFQLLDRRAWRLLMVNVIYPLSLVAVNVAIGAARLTINTDLSAGSTLNQQ